MSLWYCLSCISALWHSSFSSLSSPTSGRYPSYSLIVSVPFHGLCMRENMSCCCSQSSLFNLAWRCSDLNIFLPIIWPSKASFYIHIRFFLSTHMIMGNEGPPTVMLFFFYIELHFWYNLKTITPVWISFLNFIFFFWSIELECRWVYLEKIAS